MARRPTKENEEGIPIRIRVGIPEYSLVANRIGREHVSREENADGKPRFYVVSEDARHLEERILGVLEHLRNQPPEPIVTLQAKANGQLRAASRLSEMVGEALQERVAAA